MCPSRGSSQNVLDIFFSAFILTCISLFTLILAFLFSDDEENFVDEGSEDFKPSEPQSKAEARGSYTYFVEESLKFIMSVLQFIKRHYATSCNGTQRQGFETARR